MFKHFLWAVSLISLVAVSALADTISFSTFVTGPSINAAVGGNSTIAFNYAGNEFVGSVYFNNQLYSTNLSGGNVTKFGSPLPETSGSVGEVVVGASLGQGGFPKGDIYAGSQADGKIYQYANSGGAPSLFATLPGGSGGVRQIFFDPGSTFGGNMLVTTSSGNIFKVNSAGTPSLLASIGEDTEGMDIAPSTWGPYAGDLLVTSEGSGTLRLVSPAGAVTVVGSFPGAETVSTIPTNLDLSNPLEGFYVANYASNIQFASASQFISQGLLGDVIVTDEFGGSTAWDVHFNTMTGGFSSSQFTFNGNPISQFEDGIFVTPQRIIDNGTPEPSSLVLMGAALLAMGFIHLRKRKTAV